METSDTSKISMSARTRQRSTALDGLGQRESNDWSTYKPTVTAKTLYLYCRSPDGLVYRSLIDCRRAHYHNEALTKAAMHGLKVNFDSEEDGGDDDIFAEVATTTVLKE